MRTLLRVLLLLLVAAPLLLLAAVFLAIDDKPAVERLAALTPAHVERARWLLARNDPRRMRAGVLRTIVVSQEDLDLAVRQIVSRAVVSEGVVDIFKAAGLERPDISILSDDFLAEGEAAWRATVARMDGRRIDLLDLVKVAEKTGAGSDG